MLEQRIEQLENQVAQLTLAIERLTEVLTGANPPPALAVVQPIEGVEQEQSAPPTKEVVQQALVNLSHAKGKAAAKASCTSSSARAVSSPLIKTTTAVSKSGEYQSWLVKPVYRCIIQSVKSPILSQKELFYEFRVPGVHFQVQSCFVNQSVES